MKRDKTRALVIQGDVLLYPVESFEGDWQLAEGTRHTLALGEVTGHAHVLEGATLLRSASGDRVVEVQSDAVLRHEDHGPIAVAPGVYRVIQQTEPDLLGGFRAVAD
jgi:hypothetical protein